MASKVDVQSYLRSLPMAERPAAVERINAGQVPFGARLIPMGSVTVGSVKDERPKAKRRP